MMSRMVRLVALPKPGAECQRSGLVLKADKACANSNAQVGVDGISCRVGPVRSPVRRRASASINQPEYVSIG
jgi:hypothetical protein